MAFMRKYIGYSIDIDNITEKYPAAECYGFNKTFCSINGVDFSETEIYAVFLKKDDQFFILASKSKPIIGKKYLLKSGDIFFDGFFYAVDPETNLWVDLGMECNWDLGTYLISDPIN